MSRRPTLEDGDVLVRPQHGNACSAYLLGTTSAPDQFGIGTRGAAVAQALGYAEHEGVSAWIASDEGDWDLLGTYRRQHRSA